MDIRPYQPTLEFVNRPRLPATKQTSGIRHLFVLSVCLSGIRKAETRVLNARASVEPGVGFLVRYELENQVQSFESA